MSATLFDSGTDPPETLANRPENVGDGLYHELLTSNQIDVDLHRAASRKTTRAAKEVAA